MDSIWVKIHRYELPGGDPVWQCPVCKKDIHVYGIENPKKHERCDNCGNRNLYPWEIKHGKSRHC